MSLKLLDLFCGIGGWSVGFHREGFECTGVDVVDVGYPYELLLCDVEKFHPRYCYDVVVASPPCTQFSKASMPWHYDTESPSTRLVEETLRIVEAVEAKFWVLENVRGAVPYIEPILGEPVKKVGSRYLWGKFPIFDCEAVYGKWRMPPMPLRSWLRSCIPLPLSLALAKACKQELEAYTCRL